MNSRNHHMYSTVGQILHEDIAGLSQVCISMSVSLWACTFEFIVVSGSRLDWLLAAAVPPCECSRRFRRECCARNAMRACIVEMATVNLHTRNLSHCLNAESTAHNVAMWTSIQSW